MLARVLHHSRALGSNLWDTALGQLREKFLALLTAKDGYDKPPSEVGRRVTVRLGEAERPRPGGGDQSSVTLPEGRASDTNALTEAEMVNNRPTPNRPEDMGASAGHAATCELAHGLVVIAAITSCTNTSNPAVMIAAGLLARRAVEAGLSVKRWVKTSLAPGSRVVSEYLRKTGLQPFLDRLGFQLTGFGCTTCIGNSGPLDRGLEEALVSNDLVAAGVLSGNRNFEARIHQSVKANFLMSPPLVVAFALAGRVDVDLTREPLGVVDGREVHLRDLWPPMEEIDALLASAFDPAEYRRVYADFATQNPMWNAIPSGSEPLYQWDPASLYSREPPYFDSSMATTSVGSVTGARALAVFGDSITTDHISPAGAIASASAAGSYLGAHGVAPEDFNSYGARRGNHEVMVRGTFANVRIRNALVPGVEGGFTVHQPSGERMGIYEAAERYRGEGVPLVVIAGNDYGAGSSRDWAAKGTRLLGVRAVIAAGFERIHRSNLIDLGVLPCQFPPGASAQTLGLDGTEQLDLAVDAPLRPRQVAALSIRREHGRLDELQLLVRIDTPIEAAYLSAGGILPYMLDQLLAPGASEEPTP